MLTLDYVTLYGDELFETPTRKDGISETLETHLRFAGCELLQSAGIMLKLPQVAIATSMMLFHRFYYTRSMKRFSVESVAMASLFLAGKVEESIRGVRDVLNVFYFLKQKRKGVDSPQPMEYYGNVYYDMKNDILRTERYILKELGFNVHVPHPHKLIISYLKVLNLVANTELVQRTWNYMNDSLCTLVFIRYNPYVITCAAIYLACRDLQISLPIDPSWWEIFDVSIHDVIDACRYILHYYQRESLPISSLPLSLDELDGFLKKYKPAT